MPQIHETEPLITAGTPLDTASAAMIMIHGRGATPHSILELMPYLDVAGFAFLAPTAKGQTWYPNRFLAPIAQNEPYLSSALNTVDGVIKQVNDAGIPAEKTLILGFSQGACLALEYAARNPQRYGGVIALSGGLIGDSVPAVDYIGSLDNTPLFIGCSDVDFHVPVERVRESTALLQQLGGDVTERIYPNMGHTINQDEIDFVKQLMQQVAS